MDTFYPVVEKENSSGGLKVILPDSPSCARYTARRIPFDEPGILTLTLRSTQGSYPLETFVESSSYRREGDSWVKIDGNLEPDRIEPGTLEHKAFELLLAELQKEAKR